MALCKECGDEDSELVLVKIGGKKKKMCGDCADRARESDEIAADSQGVMQRMMEYKGR